MLQARRLIAHVCLAGLVSAVAPATVSAQTAGGCQFVLGFQVLHDLAPADIGDCIDNQATQANGDAQQHTTKGLLAWRRADNWTAFTNGYKTWIKGPNGLAVRLNIERFPWEATTGPSAPPTPATTLTAASPQSAPSLTCLAVGRWRVQALFPDGSTQAEDVVLNADGRGSLTTLSVSAYPNLGVWDPSPLVWSSTSMGTVTVQVNAYSTSTLNSSSCNSMAGRGRNLPGVTWTEVWIRE